MRRLMTKTVIALSFVAGVAGTARADQNVPGQVPAAKGTMSPATKEAASGLPFSGPSGAPVAGAPEAAVDVDKEIDIANIVTSAAKGGAISIQEAPAIIT